VNNTATAIDATTTAELTMADRIRALGSPDKIGCQIHADCLLKRHLRLHRATENHPRERRQPIMTARDTNGKTAKRTQNNATAKQTTVVATSITVMMQIHKIDNAARMIDTSSIVDDCIKRSQIT
jgi:hypothetical protein